MHLSDERVKADVSLEVPVSGNFTSGGCVGAMEVNILQVAVFKMSVLAQSNHRGDDEITIQDSAKTNQYIKLLGFLAVGGTAVGVSADFFSGWSDNPNSMGTAISLSLDNVKGLFINKPRWTYVLGNYLGVLFLPFHIVGSYLIYLALKPAGKKYALIYFFPATYLAAVGGGYHGTYAFVGDIIQSGDEALMSKMLDYWQYWGAALIVGYSVLSIFLFIRILQGQSIFPKWVAIVSPISVIIATAAVTLFMPDDMIGTKSFLTVTGLNLPLAVFYLIATVFLLREKKVDLAFP